MIALTEFGFDHISIVLVSVNFLVGSKPVKREKSLNKVIESIINNTSNKKDNGITEYLTNGYCKKDVFEASAVISAMKV